MRSILFAATMLLALAAGGQAVPPGKPCGRCVVRDGGIVRGDTTRKRIALVFTAAAWADGADTIINTMKSRGVKGSFFFTGGFYEKFSGIIARLVKGGHYVGSHGYAHLLYAPWGSKRDSTIVSKEEFDNDILKGYALMAEAGIKKEGARYFIPPYEHYNSTISEWARQLGLQIINYTPGTRSNADYTTPDMKSYASSEELFATLDKFEKEHTLNGHFLMLHFGTHPARTDKFYNLLPRIIDTMQGRGYSFVTVDEMIEQ